jgi:thiol-disulfide isomerase/thioredoxin
MQTRFIGGKVMRAARARTVQGTGPLIWVGVFLALVIGCGPESPSINDGAAAIDDDTKPEVTVRVADTAAYDEVIAKHRGQVVLVDFWATWCTGCVEQFPHTVKLHHDFGDKGLAVVSVSCNDVEEEEEVLKMLKRFGAEFDNLLSQYGSESTDVFEIDGLPSYKLYDRQGKLRYTLGDADVDNPLTTDDIDARVEELLAEEADGQGP